IESGPASEWVLAPLEPRRAAAARRQESKGSALSQAQTMSRGFSVETIAVGRPAAQASHILVPLSRAATSTERVGTRPRRERACSSRADQPTGKRIVSRFSRAAGYHPRHAT